MEGGRGNGITMRNIAPPVCYHGYGSLREWNERTPHAREAQARLDGLTMDLEPFEHVLEHAIRQE